MVEKRALNTAMISLSVVSVIGSILILLTTIYCEEIVYEIEKGAASRIPAGIRTLLIAHAVMLLNIVFAVSAGIFLAERYRRIFPSLKKWAAYLISFGSIIVPVPFLFYIALAIPCFKAPKMSPKLLWAAVMSVIIGMPAARQYLDNTIMSHVVFYGMVGLYVLMLFLLNSLAEENIGRKVLGTVIGFSALSIVVWGIILGYRIHLQTQVSKLEATFKAGGIPFRREELDRHLAEGKIYNDDTVRFIAVLDKIKEKRVNKEDFSEYMPELEKYTLDDHLLGKENFGRPLCVRTFPHLRILHSVSYHYDCQMDKARSADELIKIFLLGSRLNKFFCDSDCAMFNLTINMKDRLKTLEKNMKRFQFTEAQKNIISAELQKSENEMHELYSRAALYLPVMLQDTVDCVARGEVVESEGFDFFKMHPVAGAPFVCFALKAKLYGRGYVDLIGRKYNCRLDHYLLPKEKFLPDENALRKNILAEMAIPDWHETDLIRRKYETILRIRSLAGKITGKPQTDPFTGKAIAE